MSRNKMLVLAISPPPYGGQALMVRTLLDSGLETLEMHHVRMEFSSSMSAVGRIQLRKVIHMISIVFAAIKKRFKSGTCTLYYVPGGSNMAPVLRDIFILLCLRPFFSRRIFHFHAAGVSEIVQSLPGVIRSLANFVYNDADLAIFLSSRNPDNLYFNSKHKAIVPNGVVDEVPEGFLRRATESIPRILFVGVVQESKGVTELINAAHTLQSEGFEFHVDVVGEWVSDEYKVEIQRLCDEYSLCDKVTFHGIKVGEEKWKLFRAADVFCFPSFFESESFGNVLVEAMMNSLPVVSTVWRGIPDIVEHGKTGLLIPVKDQEKLVECLTELLQNSELRSQMGRAGRRKFEEKYQLETFVGAMKNALDSAFES